MSNLKKLLFNALELAKLEEKATKNTVIAKQIGSVINKNFKDRETQEEVSRLMKGSAPAEINSESGGPKGLKVWKPGMSKKNSNKASSTKEVAAVDNTTSDDNGDILDDDFNPKKIAEMTPQAIIDHFGTMDKVREASKNLGYTIDPAIEPMKFIEEFQEAVLLSNMESEEE